MTDNAADFDFVGGAYKAADPLQANQELINWYTEVASVKGAKMPVALLGTPGLNPLFTLTANTPVRGFWVLPGNTTALAVSGSAVWLITVATPATSTAIATFTTTQVGTIGTSSGPVVIRDNGVSVAGLGGFALIVDGSTTGYYFSIGGAYTYTFIGATTAGSQVITLNSLPFGVLSSLNATLTDSGSAVPGGTYIQSIDINTPALAMSNAATATVGSNQFTLNIPQFGQLSDPGFVGSDRLAFIEGWLVANQPGTRNFYTTGPIAYTLIFPPTFFALKDSSTDNLITLHENNRELWLIGERTSEVWAPVGGTNFYFARLPGIGPQIGCGAKHSITRLGMELAWLGRNEQGENVVVKQSQYTVERISSHGVDHAIASYDVVSDAIGYAYEEDGHLFYVLTFPTADVTWVYDATVAGKLGHDNAWHQRLSYDPVACTYHCHRSNCFANFADLRLVGDVATGQVHQMSRSVYTDAGNPLRAKRRAPHVWSRESRKRVFYSRLQIEFTPGVGLSTGQGSSPQAMLKWSDDGGQTWSNEHWASIGLQGQTKNRAVWNRLGQSWDRIFEVVYTDPTPRDIVGASLFAEGEN